jgi:hypothetical protein
MSGLNKLNRELGLRLRQIVFTVVIANTLTGLSSPVEEFKDFLNKKPTVEDFRFRLKTTDNKIRGLNASTYRLFALIYQENHAFSFSEDRHGYLTNTALIKFWGKFENMYWARFNSNDVITAIVQTPSEEVSKNEGPLGEINANINMALDGLNLGVIDLGTNGVVWSGMDFAGFSNIGAKINGHLLIGNDEMPSGLIMHYEYGRKIYQYRVYYEYDKTKGLPVFFPHKIRVDYINESKTQTISDYDILKLTLSKRQLNFGDVDYSQWINTNSDHFVFTNKDVHYFKKISGDKLSLQPVLKASQTLKTKRPVSLFAVVFIVISVGFASAVYTQLKKHKKKE